MSKSVSRDCSYLQHVNEQFSFWQFFFPLLILGNNLRNNLRKQNLAKKLSHATEIYTFSKTVYYLLSGICGPPFGDLLVIQ